MLVGKELTCSNACGVTMQSYDVVSSDGYVRHFTGIDGLIDYVHRVPRFYGIIRVIREDGTDGWNDGFGAEALKRYVELNRVSLTPAG